MNEQVPTKECAMPLTKAAVERAECDRQRERDFVAKFLPQPTESDQMRDILAKQLKRVTR
jgi:hypothetical protein